MRYLNVEDRSEMDEQAQDDDLLADALIYKTTDDLTYNHYAFQRSFYGISAQRLAPHYPRADKYEARYQEDQKRLGKAA
jgi:hypothetical protein